MARRSEPRRFCSPLRSATTSFWKIGQLRPGDLVHSAGERGPASRQGPGVVCRADGDRALLVEYSPNVLDLNLRFRVHALESQLRAANLQASWTSRRAYALTDSLRHPIPRCETLLDALGYVRATASDLNVSAPSRIVHLRCPGEDRLPLCGHSQVHAVSTARRALVPE